MTVKIKIPLLGVDLINQMSQVHASSPQIDVQIYSPRQLPKFLIIGLPNRAVKEAQIRIKAAIESANFRFPRRKLIVNLSPSDIPKQGTELDLGMTLAILQYFKHINLSQFLKPNLNIISAWGEVGFNSEVLNSQTIEQAYLRASEAQVSTFLCNRSDAEKLIRTTPMNEQMPWIVGIKNLTDLKNLNKCLFYKPNSVYKSNLNKSNPITELPVTLPTHLVRLAQLNLIGNFSTLFLGTRSAHHSEILNLIKTLIKLLPKKDVNHSDLHELDFNTKANQLTGKLKGNVYIPGELYRAKNGVILTENLPLWSKESRQILERAMVKKECLITNGNQTISFNCNIQLLATATYCPCGGHPKHWDNSHNQDRKVINVRICNCTKMAREHYKTRILSSLFEQFDLVVPTDNSNLGEQSSNESIKCPSQLLNEINGAKNKLDQLFESDFYKIGLTQIQCVIEKKSIRLPLGADEALNLPKLCRWIKLAYSIWALENAEQNNSDFNTSVPHHRHFSEASLYLGDLLWGLIPSYPTRLVSNDVNRWIEEQRKSQVNDFYPRHLTSHNLKEDIPPIDP